MASKNNNDRPRAEREYFDRPVNYIYQGFTFQPVHKRPIELQGDIKSSTLRSRMSMDIAKQTTPTQMKRQLEMMSTGFSTFSSSRRKSELYPPITTGMNNTQFYMTQYRKPKDFSEKSGELSLNFGIIPALRSPERKKVKRRVNKAKSSIT